MFKTRRILRFLFFLENVQHRKPKILVAIWSDHLLKTTAIFDRNRPVHHQRFIQPIYLPPFTQSSSLLVVVSTSVARRTAILFPCCPCRGGLFSRVPLSIYPSIFPGWLPSGHVRHFFFGRHLERTATPKGVGRELDGALRQPDERRMRQTAVEVGV